ncbi:unnamed protein product [Fraxinus pennsylvanica]|uniref:Uncharacterized protein n=1 Tax=Fraxinus pennsylvanica TaxID=56036 RepID=A0AAD1ZBB9_9LAMI|nr:unnamed protein product [Fraxinus pennsylvanica]
METYQFSIGYEKSQISGILTMENSRRQRWDNHRQEPPRRKSPQYKKPPRGSWQPRVPSWEKEFCKVIGEEAFSNAKKRFWAKSQGLPCDASLPDPDLYIDEINWSSEIDPEVQLELECNPEIPKAGLHDWDGTANVCADYLNNTWHVSDVGGAIGHMPWEGNWNDNWGWNHSNGHENQEVKPIKPKNFEDKKADNVQGSWDGNNMGRVDDAGRYLSRYRTPRFQSNEHRKNHLWWNDRGRRR